MRIEEMNIDETNWNYREKIEHRDRQRRGERESESTTKPIETCTQIHARTHNQIQRKCILYFNIEMINYT